MQERLRPGRWYPWQMLTACALLNRTRGAQARPAIFALLADAPDPRSLLDLGEDGLRERLRPLGLWRRRAASLRALALACEGGVPRDPRGLPGVGQYALDSWALFVEAVGPLRRPPDDDKLRRFDEWLRRLRGEPLLRQLRSLRRATTR